MNSSPTSHKAELAYMELLATMEVEVIAYREKWRPKLQKLDVDEMPEMPRFLSKKGAQELATAGDMFIEAIKKIPQEVFNNDLELIKRTLGAHFIKDSIWSEFLSLPVDYPMARPDTIFSEKGLQFLEQNISSSLNNPIQLGLVDYFKSHPVILEMMQQGWEIETPSFFDGLKKLFIERGYQGKYMAIMVGSETDPADSRWLAELIESWGIDVCVPDMRSVGLTYGSGYVHYQGRKIDMIYRTAIGLTMIGQTDFFRQVLQAALSGKVELFTNPLEELFCDKGLMAYLSDPQLNGFLTAQEKSLFETVLPWTRKIDEKISRDAQILSARGDYYIKAGLGSESSAVYSGKHIKPEEWGEVLKIAATAGDSVIQKVIVQSACKVPVIRNSVIETFSCYSVDSPYLFGRQFSGLFTRASGYFDNELRTPKPKHYEIENVGVLVNEK